MNSIYQAFLKVVFAFFVWSLLGPILNLSSFTATQNIWFISVLACFYLLIYAWSKRIIDNLRMIKINSSLIIFLVASGLSGVLWLQSLTVMPIAKAALLYQVIPFFTFLLGYLFLKEGLQRLKIFAILLGFAGVVIILSREVDSFSLDNKLFLGVIAVLSAAFLTATQAVIAKKFSFHYPTWIMVFLIMIAQTIVATPFAFSQSFEITPFAVGGVLFLSLFSSIIAFFFYVDGFKFLKSSTVTLVGYIEPFLVAVWGYIFLQQILALNVILGGCLILTAGYLGIKSEEKK